MSGGRNVGAIVPIALKAPFVKELSAKLTEDCPLCGGETTPALREDHPVKLRLPPLQGGELRAQYIQIPLLGGVAEGRGGSARQLRRCDHPAACGRQNAALTGYEKDHQSCLIGGLFRGIT